MLLQKARVPGIASNQLLLQVFKISVRICGNDLFNKFWSLFSSQYSAAEKFVHKNKFSFCYMWTDAPQFLTKFQEHNYVWSVIETLLF